MDCTIIIFHYESIAYLRACIRRIRAYKRDDIAQKIIIAEQSRDKSIVDTVVREFTDSDIRIEIIPSFGSGYSVDHIMRHVPITTEYICTMDVDTIPIHPNWLYVPIKLIRDEGFSMVGVHAEIESAYAYMGDFFCMCQHFRVGKTDDFMMMSRAGGFTKNDHRSKLTFTNTEWHGWSDDGVPAHWWEDKYLKHNKLALQVDKYLGVAPLEGRYGRYTDDLVFHFGFSYNWKMVGDKEQAMGEEFLTWMKRMDEEGLSDAMIDEILSKLIPLEAPRVREVWDGTTKTISRPTEKLNAKIEQLKTE